MTERASCTVAKIAVENCAFSFDTLFSFSVPASLAGAVAPGRRVLVPFGRGNTLRQGFVFALETPETEPEGLKPVFSVSDEGPLLNDEMLALAETLRERTFSTWFASAKAMLPGGMCLKTEKRYRVKEVPPAAVKALGEETREVYAYLGAKRAGARESELTAAFGVRKTGALLASLLAAGAVEAEPETLKIRGEVTRKTFSLAAPDLSLFGALTEKQRAAAEFLLEMGEATGKEISYYTGVSEAVVRRLVEKGVLVENAESVPRRPQTGYRPSAPQRVTLSDEQRAAFERLLAAYRSGEPKTALLFGVTGSGKTNVYLELIDAVLADGRGVIVLVPEISLTPQTVAAFLARFGDRVAVMHSGLSVGERRDEFFRVKRGEATVVVGTRSAVFAPLADLGAIIIDEEQEHTYQSETSPRYDARTVARLRAKYHGALTVFASATPSVETYARAETGSYLKCELKSRYGAAKLPAVLKVDMSDQALSNPFSSLSVPLERELKLNLENGEQSILLVNRRGYNTFVVCQSCKTVVRCPNCSISMTYHQANHRLMCHYCGYSAPYQERCPVCGAANVRYEGFGTQRVEQELGFRFPEARILRMDADTTTAKNAHDAALSAFAAGEYDILVGTQMVAKGLDFPNVSLVGVVSADNEMYGGDFRGAEKTFDLITQVVGRAGRGDKKGRAVIQTLTPDNAILDLAARQDYPAFFKQEIAMRRGMIYPPFCDICLMSFSAEDREAAERCAKRFFDALKEAAEARYPEERLILLGPLPHKVPRINKMYRLKLLLKCKNSRRIRSLIAGTMQTVSAEKEFRAVSLFAVMNPDRTD